VVRDGRAQPASEWTCNYIAQLVAEMRAREGRCAIAVTEETIVRRATVNVIGAMRLLTGECLFLLA
jgi:hypothetical protein